MAINLIFFMASRNSNVVQQFKDSLPIEIVGLQIELLDHIQMTRFVEERKRNHVTDKRIVETRNQSIHLVEDI